uniref:CPG4 domain-containing protein n=1 Tax=Parastrongyloides trichosuri TaxID=131310 RepID=A0A0N4ZV82_PARTI
MRRQFHQIFILMMKCYFSCLILFTLLTFLAQGSSVNVTVDELTNAIGAPPCMKKCINRLIVNLYDALTNRDVHNATAVICSEYDDFVECAHRDRFVCPYERIYNITFEGIQSFCSKKEEAPHTPCLDAKVSRLTAVCNKNCGLAEQIDNIFEKKTIKIMARYSGSPFIFLDNLTEFCVSLSCFFPCMKNNLKKECREDGHEFIIHTIKPFYSLLNLMKKHPGIKPLIQNKVPTTCHFLFNKLVLDSFSKY